MSALEDRIEAALGQRPHRLGPLSGGCVSQVWRVDLAAGDRLVAKEAAPGANLETEAWMLAYLAGNTGLPVPTVVHADPDLLLMTYIDNDGRLDREAQAHAADLIADLHGHAADAYGLERDTLIGPLHQPNPWTADWVAFFRDQRLLYMARCCREAGRLRNETFGRIESLAGRLDELLPSPAGPALIHGDLWGGNVLTAAGRIAGFIDPAIYVADPEIELAFSTLFGTFGDAFFARYREHRPIADGFFETRRPLYNLYPLLVHVRLFGGSYVAQVEAVLDRLGIP